MLNLRKLDFKQTLKWEFQARYKMATELGKMRQEKLKRPENWGKYNSKFLCETLKKVLNGLDAMWAQKVRQMVRQETTIMLIWEKEEWMYQALNVGTRKYLSIYQVQKLGFAHPKTVKGASYLPSDNIHFAVERFWDAHLAWGSLFLGLYVRKKLVSPDWSYKFLLHLGSAFQMVMTDWDEFVGHLDWNLVSWATATDFPSQLGIDDNLYH